jgi:hypothetical protein
MHSNVVSDRSLMDPMTLDKRAAEWKFGILDIDKNNNLTKVEYRDLKRLVRKVIRPKRCSRTFIRICDTDRNSVVSKTEWTNCLSIDGKRNAEHCFNSVLIFCLVTYLSNWEGMVYVMVYIVMSFIEKKTFK